MSRLRSAFWLLVTAAVAFLSLWVMWQIIKALSYAVIGWMP